jgi:putative proteasome-type protease
VPGERLIVLQTAGNLATSQSVINLLQQRTQGNGPHLLNVATLYDATVLVADTLREVVRRDRSKLTADIDLSSSFIVGGQIAGGPMAIYNVYAQGNFFQATPDTPFLQLGESKYGRPILDRNLDYRTPLDEALRCGLISFDSTIRSNLSVGMPLDLLVYRDNSLESMTRKRITSDDAYYQQIRRQWSDGLKTLLAELPAPPYG